jgi:hypothetical protein
MIERQRIRERTKPKPLGPLRDRGEKQTRRWRKPEGRPVMLCKVVSVESILIAGLKKRKPTFKLLAKRNT